MCITTTGGRPARWHWSWAAAPHEPGRAALHVSKHMVVSIRQRNAAGGVRGVAGGGGAERHGSQTRRICWALQRCSPLRSAVLSGLMRKCYFPVGCIRGRAAGDRAGHQLRSRAAHRWLVCTLE